MATGLFQLILPVPKSYKPRSTLAQSSPLALFQAKTKPVRTSSATVIAKLLSAFQRPHTTRKTRTWTPSTVGTEYHLQKSSLPASWPSPYAVPSIKALCWKASRLEIVLFCLRLLYSIYWTWLKSLSSPLWAFLPALEVELEGYFQELSTMRPE